MPIFEYLCDDCGHEFEKLVFGEKQIECPKCQSSKIQKKISGFATTAGSAETPCGSSCSNFT